MEKSKMTKWTASLLLLMVLFGGLMMTALGQETLNSVEGEIADAPIDPTLAAMNQVPLRFGALEARVTQVELMVNRDYPPGQPTLYVADRTLRLPTQFVANDPRRRSEVGLEWTFDTRRGQALTIVNGCPQIL